MSGMIIIRRENGIELYSDGGHFRSVEDFTITGFASKPIVLPHLSAVMCCIGTAEFGQLLQNREQQKWSSFDQLLEVIEETLISSARMLVEEWSRTTVTGCLFLGGYSERREAWESYVAIIEAERGREPQMKQPATKLPVWFFPAPPPDDASLRRYGFDPETMDLHPADAPVRYMRAMRASHTTLAGFIERVILTRDFAASQILWRWPDEAGKLVNPDDEGTATPAFDAMLESLQRVDVSGPDGRVHCGDKAAPDDATARKAGDASSNGFNRSDATMAANVILRENDLPAMNDAGRLVPATVAGETATGEAEELPDDPEDGAEETPAAATRAGKKTI